VRDGVGRLAVTNPCDVVGTTHQSLAYRFVLSCHDPEIARAACSMLADFAPPVAGAYASGPSPVATYSIEPWPDQYRAQLGLYLDGVPIAINKDPARIIDRLVRHVSSMALAAAPSDLLLVHAGVAATPAGDAVLLTGESGSGKTTIVAALVQDGYGYLSDEAAVIEPDALLVMPWPRPLDFKPGAAVIDRFRGLVGEYSGLSCHVPMDRLRKGAVADPCALLTIFDYRYEPGSPTTVEPISRPEAVAVLGSATPALRHHGTRGLEVLARVVRGAEAYRLRSGSLEEAVHSVRTLAER
jgi:hypothetical protein